MEEEQARQAAAVQAQVSNPPSIPATAPLGTAAPPEQVALADDEEAQLQRALAMSEGRDVEMADSGAAVGGADEETSEEEMIARAIEMSMRGEGEQKK